jgi:hypothetical protein
MKTLAEMIEIIRAENPDGLRIGDEESGYTQLSAADYEAQITIWAENRLAKLTKIAAEEAEAQAEEEAKIDAIAKLNALGIDPKALGLTIKEEIAPISGTLD